MTRSTRDDDATRILALLLAIRFSFAPGSSTPVRPLRVWLISRRGLLRIVFDRFSVVFVKC